MLRKIISLIFLSSVTISLSFSQQPCVTEPYKGYKGDCKLTYAMSNDGRYLFTSDRLSLKIWETSSNKIVNEISPFSYDLAEGTKNADEIVVLRGDIYNKISDVYHIPSQSLKQYPPSIRSAETDKIIAKSKYPKVTEVLQKSLIFFVAESKLRKIDLNNKNKVTSYPEKFDNFYSPVYNPATNTLICTREGRLISLLNVESETWVHTKYAFKVDTNTIVDGRYHPFISDKKIHIMDLTTGTLVVEEELNNFFCSNTGGYLKVFTKPDKSGFFVYSNFVERNYNNTNQQINLCSEMLEFSFPEFKLLSQTPIHNLRSFLFNPGNASFYHSRQPFEQNNKDIGIVNIKTGNRTIFSIEEKGTYAREDKYKAEREQRTMVGNKALETLYNMKPPNGPSHTAQRAMEKLIVDDYTDKGKVVIREFHSFSATCIVWKFPEGTSEWMYKSDYMNPQVNANTVLVPGSIKQSMLSPSGNEVGFTTTHGAYIFRGNKLLYKGEKQILRALLEGGKALVCNSATDHLNTFNPDCVSHELIDIETGQKIKSAKIESYLGKSDDRKNLFISFTTSPSPVLTLINVNNPTELVQVEGERKIMEAGYPLYEANESNAYRKNSATGKEELIPGYKVPNENARDGSNVIIRDNHILAFERYGDFTVIDINKGKSVSSVPLYSGWWRFEDMVYLKGIKKLLLVHYVPIYTSPNPGENDPGASAYTIDVETGEITPYLISDTRQQYQAYMNKVAEQLAYRYSPEGKCEMRNNQYKKGTTVFDQGRPHGIIVGYDCEEEVYVVAYRELYDAAMGAYIIRVKKMTFEELLKFRQDDVHYVICPLCNGQPVSVRRETVSGWSNWEQKSLNIYVYTRKWETKTYERKDVCKTCKGAAWLKR